MDRFERAGDFSWVELQTTDLEEAKSFYQEIFGWEYSESEMPEGVYVEIKAAGQPVGGMMAMPEGVPPGTPAHWLPYVTVKDVDGVAQRAGELGGRLLVPPTDIPNVGRFCILQDPQGAVISAIQYLKREK